MISDKPLFLGKQLSRSVVYFFRSLLYGGLGVNFGRASCVAAI